MDLFSADRIRLGFCGAILALAGIAILASGQQGAAKWEVLNKNATAGFITALAQDPGAVIATISPVGMPAVMIVMPVTHAEAVPATKTDLEVRPPTLITTNVFVTPYYQSREGSGHALLGSRLLNRHTLVLQRRPSIWGC